MRSSYLKSCDDLNKLDKINDDYDTSGLSSEGESLTNSLDSLKKEPLKTSLENKI